MCVFAYQFIETTLIKYMDGTGGSQDTFSKKDGKEIYYINYDLIRILR